MGIDSVFLGIISVFLGMFMGSAVFVLFSPRLMDYLMSLSTHYGQEWYKQVSEVSLKILEIIRWPLAFGIACASCADLVDKNLDLALGIFGAGVGLSIRIVLGSIQKPTESGSKKVE